MHAFEEPHINALLTTSREKNIIALSIPTINSNCMHTTNQCEIINILRKIDDRAARSLYCSKITHTIAYHDHSTCEVLIYSRGASFKRSVFIYILVDCKNYSCSIYKYGMLWYASRACRRRRVGRCFGVIGQVRQDDTCDPICVCVCVRFVKTQQDPSAELIYG